MTDRGERFEIITRHRGLVGRTVLVSGLTLLSRLLGFVREVIMALVFGDSSAVSDAFFTAWRVPNLFRRLFGEGALSTSLQAGLTETDAEGGDEAGRLLFLRTVALMVGVLLVVSALSMLAVAHMPERMPLVGWAWLGADPEPVKDLAVRLMPYVVLVCVAALCGGALQVRGHYAAPNLAPTAMNLVWIGALLWVGAAFGWSQSARGGHADVLGTQWDMARLLAWGVLLGGVVQLVIHVPALSRFGLLRRRPGAARPKTPGPGPLQVVRRSAPLALGAAVYQINVMIDGLMAEGLLADGGPSALYYANRVQQFPLALVAIAAINAVFPALKARAHLGQREELRRLHDRTQFGVLFLALPAAVGLAVLARPIASVLFEHGNYGAEGVARLAAALQMLALALVPAGAAGLLGRTYIAAGDVRTPVRVSIWMLFVNVALNAILVRGFGMDVDGLTLATAMTSWGNLVWLLVLSRTKLDWPPSEPGALVRIGRMALAATACGVAAFGAHWLVADVLVVEWSAGALLALLAAIATGAAAYLLAVHGLATQGWAVPEWEELLARIRRRMGG